MPARKIKRINGLPQAPLSMEAQKDRDETIAFLLHQLRALYDWKLTIDDLTDIVNTGGAAHIIQDEGADLPNQPRLNFIGSGVAATNNSSTGATDVTITSSGSGTVTSIAATTPIVVTPDPITTTGTVSHATSGVTAATYGSSTQIPILAINATGHVTSASNSSAIPSNTGTSTGDSWLWGSGRDGTVHFDGVNTFSFATLSNGVYVLLRAVHATNFTIDAGITVGSMDWFTTGLGGANQIFCTDTLTVNGHLHNDGSMNTVNRTIGGIGACHIGGVNAYYGYGSNGGAGNTGAGSNGENLVSSYGGTGGAGGAGSGGNAGGTAGVITAPALAQSGGIEMLWTLALALSGQVRTGPTSTLIFGGSGGGGGGGVSGTGQPGGGAGGGGGCFGIFAREMAGSGLISCDGANGNNGQGAGTGSGGGGAGGGGVLMIWTTTLTIPCTTQCLGGTGGTGRGAGGNGSNGSNGIVAKTLVATLN